MKKMKKIAATLLCLGVAISTLCACSSTGNNKPSEESSKPAEEATTAEEPTEAPSQEPSVEPSIEESTQETTAEVIAAWDLRDESDVLEKAPETWFEFNEFLLYFRTSIVDKTVGNGIPLYRITNWPKPISVAQDPIDGEYNGDVFDIGFYIYNNGGMTCCCFEINGEIQYMANFIPMIYDPGEKVIIGYTANDDGSNGKFIKLYYSTAFKDLVGYEISDPSIYGF